jgi:hypothetical protein
VTIASSSSATLMRKRTTSPGFLLYHLLLGFLRLLLPPPPKTMAHPIRCKMIVVAAGLRMKLTLLRHLLPKEPSTRGER